jgi:hypothetical protein
VLSITRTSVSWGGWIGVANDGQVLAPQITREDQPQLPPPLADVQDDLRGAQDVASVQKSGAHARKRLEAPLVGLADELFERAYGVLLVVEGADGLKIGVAGEAPVQVGGIAGLDACGVAQHDRAQVARCRGGVDVARKAACHQRREVPRVVEVRVGEEHRGSVQRRFG